MCIILQCGCTLSRDGRSNLFLPLHSYHVHEKIQNFMVPIPAGSWHDEMIDELYASLLGRKQRDLINEEEAEQEQEEAENEDHEIVNGEAVDGLRIFG